MGGGSAENGSRSVERQGLECPLTNSLARGHQDWTKRHEVDFGCRLGWEIDF